MIIDRLPNRWANNWISLLLNKCLFTYIELRGYTLLIKYVWGVIYVLLFKILNHRMKLLQLNFNIWDVGNRHLFRVTGTLGNIAAIQSTTLLLSDYLHKKTFNLSHALFIYLYDSLFLVSEHFILVGLSGNFFLLHAVEFFKLRHSVI